MGKIFKIVMILLLFSVLVAPAEAAAPSAASSMAVSADNYAQALVVKILAQRSQAASDGTQNIQQNLQLKILSGPLAGQIVESDGISDVDVANSSVYKSGDKVEVDYSPGPNGQNIFYVTDYIRQDSLFWLVLLFIAVILIIGRRQGLAAILSLLASFLFIIKVIIPLILHGYDPLLIGGLGSFVILLIIVYLTGGFNKKSHIALVSIFLSLVITAVLSFFFANWARLTGTTSEEVAYLMEAGAAVNFQGLLLAALIIGTLGILDDIVVGQVEVVAQIRETNQKLPDKKVFAMSMQVGRAHLGAVVNTLFLAYVSVALPLLLLISLNQVPFLSFSQIINSEQIATEIVRTLVGVIGLSLSVPISTALAARYLRGEAVKSVSTRPDEPAFPPHHH